MSEEHLNTIFKIDPSDPDPAIIARAAEVIAGGGIVVFPTQSLYGLGANALDEKAVDRIFQIKRRPPEKPVLILLDNISDMDRLVTEVPPDAGRIMTAFWPGGVTLVCHALPELPGNLTAGTGKIGIRLPLHPVARHLVDAADGPITGTSANLSGQPGCAKAAEIDAAVLGEVDMVLDAGPLIGGSGSTVVDVTVTPPKILREGLVPASKILEAISGL